MTDAELALKAIDTARAITARTQQSVHRKRKLRDSERAAWLADLAERQKGLAIAHAIVKASITEPDT